MDGIIRPKSSAHHLSDTTHPEDANVTETERQIAEIPDKPEKAIVTDTESFYALVRVILHYYRNNLLDKKG